MDFDKYYDNIKNKKIDVSNPYRIIDTQLKKMKEIGDPNIYLRIRWITQRKDRINNDDRNSISTKIRYNTDNKKYEMKLNFMKTQKEHINFHKHRTLLYKFIDRLQMDIEVIWIIYSDKTIDLLYYNENEPYGNEFIHTFKDFASMASLKNKDLTTQELKDWVYAPPSNDEKNKLPIDKFRKSTQLFKKYDNIGLFKQDNDPY